MDYPSTSCSVMSSATPVMSSATLTNGVTPGFMVPPPPPVVLSPAPGPQRDPGWDCAQERSADPWAPGREAWDGRKVDMEPTRHYEDRAGFTTDFEAQPGPSSAAALEPELQTEEERDWSQSEDREERWREQQQWSNRPPVISNGPNAVVAGPSGLQSRPAPKPSPVLGKKEPPVYPPGSQEEQWQLQVEAKGRVTCPRCRSVSRKTVEGLKKHMNKCKLEPYTCPHCGKQLKTNTGMKYHIMADHSLLPSSDVNESDDRATKEKLRKILKRLGRLKCSREGCTAGFTSVMGYFYHMRTCGKEQDELEKLVLSCSHCGKNYKSKAGLEYHIRNEHAPAPEHAEQHTQPLDDLSPETSGGRAKRASAQAASLQLAQIAQIELPKDWGKRKFQSDLVPEDHKLQYTRPGLPSFSQDVLKKWRSEVKMYKKVQCPNQGCGFTYTSVSGLKAHLGLCTKGDFAAGKYCCLICNKEFNSESGVKYHINSVHSQDWFVTNKKHLKMAKNSPSNPNDKFTQTPPSHCSHHHHHHHLQHAACPHHIQSPLQPLQPLHHLAQQNQQTYAEQHGGDQQGAPELYAPLQTVWGEKGQPAEEKDADPERNGGAARCGFEFSRNGGGEAGGFTDEEMERQIWEEKRRMLESVEIVRRQ